jgi:Rieske Fe-S protein
MLKRAALMSGWLVMSLLTAAMAVPVLTPSAEAAKVKLRAGGSGDKAMAETPADAAALKVSSKPVVTEPPKPVTVINRTEDSARHQERANRTLKAEGEEDETRPETAATMTVVKDAEAEEKSQAATAANPPAAAKPAQKTRTSPSQAYRAPREYANGVVCIAGCD